MFIILWFGEKMSLLKISFQTVFILLIISVFSCRDSNTARIDFQDEVPEKVHPVLQMLPIPSGLGVNIHFYKGNENDLKMLEDAGVGIVRMDVSWSGAEKEKGIYDFSHYDQLISDLEKRNIRLLFIIDYGNQFYDEGLAPFSDEARFAYVEFCAAIAERYADKNIIWELWNEPNLDHFWKPKTDVNNYMKWCKAVVPAIRKNDKDGCIIAPATSGFDIPFMETCFKQGLLDLIDGVSVHPYRNANLAPETTANEYNILTNLIEQYKPKGKRIPVISGEWGYSTSLLSRELQGKYIARQWLSNMANNISISIWYDWHDDGKDPQNTEHNFGTVTWDYKPKSAYIALKTLIDQLKGFIPIGRINIDDLNDYVVVFIADDNIKFAAWTTEDQHEIEFDKKVQFSSFVDFLGNFKELPGENKLSVSDGPKYLTLVKPYPDWLQLIVKAFQMNETETENVANAFINNNEKNKYVGQLRESIQQETKIKRNAGFFALNLIAQKVERIPALSLKLYHHILENDADVLNIKKALFALARLSSLKSLEIIRPLLRNPSYSQEIANYYLRLAFELTIQKKFKRAEELLVKAAQFSEHRYSVERVIAKMGENGKKIEAAKLSVLSRKAGFVNSWWIAGPFPNEKNMGSHAKYFPEKNIEFKQVEKFDSLTARWQKVELDGIYAIISLAELFGKKQQVVYAFAELNAPQEMSAKFKIGSNDGVICWLNGKKVHENLIGRKLTVDEDKVDIHLKKGTNKILLKIPNEGGNWEVCLRVCEPNGMPMDINQYLVQNE